MRTMSDTPPDYTPEQIRAIRVSQGLSQSEAARRVGVSRRSWAAWESGEKPPSPRSVILIRLLADEKL
jgi:DNA-binding transcriptional regulator YiaG